MEDFAGLYSSLRLAWRGLPLGPFERQVIIGFSEFMLCFGVIFLIERIYGMKAERYKSRVFAHDIAYAAYYKLGMIAVFTVPLMAVLEPILSRLSSNVLNPLPFPVQMIIYLLLGDFVQYWLHQAQHRVRFLWAFHSTHHTQEQLSFATFYRVHPVDVILESTLVYISLRLLGDQPLVLYPFMTLVYELQAMLAHSLVPWKFGPFYKFFLSPAFHAYHHSTDPAHRNKNFCDGIFTFWDYLFGTAVKDNEPMPRNFGVPNMRSTSLWSSLVTTPLSVLFENHVAARRKSGGTST